MLAATAAGILLTTNAIAHAQSGDAVPQPYRPGRGGTDPGPRNLMRDRQNPALTPPELPRGSIGSVPKVLQALADLAGFCGCQRRSQRGAVSI